jgi:hypothetical protein
MEGFLGTGATFGADANLLAQVTMALSPYGRWVAGEEEILLRAWMRAGVGGRRKPVFHFVGDAPIVLKASGSAGSGWIVRSFKSETLTAGGKFEHRFERAGTFPYFCTFHGSKGGQDMAGTVTVK